MPYCRMMEGTGRHSALPKPRTANRLRLAIITVRGHLSCGQGGEGIHSPFGWGPTLGRCRVPRYRFSWDNVPDDVVGALAEGLGLVGDPRAELRSWYGVRPRPDFIEASWQILLDSWLAKDAAARGKVVTQMSTHGLGDTSLLKDPADPVSQMTYLRSLRNAATLRSVVLSEFHVLGEPTQVPGTASPTAPPAAMGKPSGTPPEPRTPESKASDTPENEPDPVAVGLNRTELKAWVQKYLAFRFGHEFEVDDDGDIPVWRGSSCSYIRVDTERPMIEVFSQVVLDIPKNPALFEAVNEINLRDDISKAMVVEDGTGVLIAASLMADVLSTNGLTFLLDRVTDVADYFDTRLVQRFGGHTAGPDQPADATDV